METILDRIKQAASKKGVTVSSLADRTGISEPSFYRWEKSSPNSTKLKIVADELGVSTDWLLGRTSEVRGQGIARPDFSVDGIDYNVKLISHGDNRQPIIRVSAYKDDFKISESEYSEKKLYELAQTSPIAKGVIRELDQMPGFSKPENKIDLNKVSDSERDKMISANGQPISDDDWAIIKAVLAKYPKRD